MTHATIYKSGDADFNEAMATFVGRTAAQRFFVARYGADSDELKAAMDRYDDEAVIDDFVVRLFTDAKAYYEAAAARGDDRETIIAGRDAVFDASVASFASDYEPKLKKPDDWTRLRSLKINNAIILGGVRYQAGLSDFADVLAAAGDDFPIALQVFSDAAKAADSRSYLRQWAMEH
ncbi:MAG: aminopeptidase [Planctomycetes bacterium]|nr:aminopeptidase [Planctomycetota bacterium]